MHRAAARSTSRAKHRACVVRSGVKGERPGRDMNRPPSLPLIRRLALSREDHVRGGHLEKAVETPVVVSPLAGDAPQTPQPALANAAPREFGRAVESSRADTRGLRQACHRLHRHVDALAVVDSSFRFAGCFDEAVALAPDGAFAASDDVGIALALGCPAGAISDRGLVDSHSDDQGPADGVGRGELPVRRLKPAHDGVPADVGQQDAPAAWSTGVPDPTSRTPDSYATAPPATCECTSAEEWCDSMTASTAPAKQP